MTYRLALPRRDLLRGGLSGAALGAVSSPAVAAETAAFALVADPADAVAAAACAQWSLGELQAALSATGAQVRRIERVEQARADELCIVATGPDAATISDQHLSIDGAEGLVLARTRISGRNAVLARGSDARGLMYALLELADRVKSGSSAAQAFAFPAPVVERPANAVRSIMRPFVSETFDKPWFNDRGMWPAYFAMMAANRFNRLHLGFGIGYDTLQRVTDSYLLFAYPFFVDVPGYPVSVANLSAAERDANLAMLNYIGAEAVAHGVDFQVGIWIHGYQLIDSPDARYVVQGLTPDTHAAYCRDALAALLKACPTISSVVLRIHGESGVPEGHYDFWQTIFDGVPRSGRRVEIDLHAKGADETMIAHAAATGMPINVSVKCWAEHLGMPYQQAAIRDLEMPEAGRVGRGLMTLSEGSRSFTRYGYGDFLRDDRSYGVRYRVVAGSQKILLSGDPLGMEAYSRCFSFGGGAGFDVMEPLTNRGRRGTAVPGARRSGYVDASLEPHWDWQKYLYWYRVWGRLGYDANAAPETWRRHFGADARASALITALANASRIVPLVTMSHMPSAASDAYWPEIYWNQPLAAESDPNPYTDTAAPKTFQHASPLDPQTFAGMDEHAEDLLAARQGEKYSPIEVAQWLEAMATAVDHALAAYGAPGSVDARRMVIDAGMQAELGRFFAAKFRAGVLYAVYERASDRRALDAALTHYRVARAAWARLVERARGVYADDLAVSDKISARGAWADRLAAIDHDIAALETLRAGAGSQIDARVSAALAATRETRPVVTVTHTPPPQFEAGRDLALTLSLTHAQVAVRCFYRHVDQAERYEAVDMAGDGRAFRCAIPAAYTDSHFALQYYFAVKGARSRVSLYPGLGQDLLQQPYFVVRRASP